MREEEELYFPKLRAAMSLEQQKELYRSLVSAKKDAPTHASFLTVHRPDNPTLAKVSPILAEGAVGPVPGSGGRAGGTAAAMFVFDQIGLTTVLTWQRGFNSSLFPHAAGVADCAPHRRCHRSSLGCSTGPQVSKWNR